MVDSGKKVDAEVGGTAHSAPLSLEQMDSVRDIIEIAQRFSGYVPTSFCIMARKPNILRTFNALIAAVMREPGDLYLPPERVAVALALAAGQVPNSSTREHFDALRVHFSDDAIVEIVAV